MIHYTGKDVKGIPKASIGIPNASIGIVGGQPTGSGAYHVFLAMI